MSKRTDFKSLRTIGQVQAERRRVEKEIDRCTEYINDDCRQLSQMLTLGYWIDALVEKTSGIGSLVQTAYSGYRLISSIFLNKNKKGRA